MRKSLTLLATLILVGLLSGCGSSPTGPAGSGSSTDRAQVADQLAQNPQYVDDEVYQSDDSTPMAAAGSGAAAEGVAAAVTPLNFFRHITHVDRTFEFAFSDTDSTGHPLTAVVTVHKHLTGTFNVVAASDSVFGERHVIRKALDEQWTRRILLKRGRGSVAGQAGWRIEAFSGVDVRSQDAATHIVSLRVQAGALDSTVTDPLGYLHITRGLRFARPDSVVLTVTTLRNDDVVVLQRPERRFRFHNNGDNTYTGVFRAPFVLGIHHLGLNALSHGSIFDDQAAYDSESWLFPYVLRHEDLAGRQP
jgi:hypothetical protein